MKEELIIDINVDIDKIIKRVDTAIARVEKGYISIVGDVAHLAELKAYEQFGYANIYEMCAAKWGMSRGTVHNLISISKRYCDENYKLTDEGKTLSIREMLNTIKDEKVKKLEDGKRADTRKKDVLVEVETDAPVINIGFEMTELWQEPTSLSVTDISMLLKERFGGVDNAIKLEIKVYTQS